jgi:hypothetical protein
MNLLFLTTLKIREASLVLSTYGRIEGTELGTKLGKEKGRNL